MIVKVPSLATAAAKKVWIVAVNKTRAAIALDLALTHDTPLTKAQIVTLTDAEAKPPVVGTYSVASASFTVDAPAMSAVLIALAP